MNPRRLLLALILGSACCSAIFGQGSASKNKEPVSVLNLIEFFAVVKLPNENASALELLDRNCNVDFIDDGTNFWALRTVGASEELMKRVDSCTSAAIRDRINAERSTLSEEQIQIQERLFIGNLFRKMFTRKDIAGRRRTLAVGEEYIRRYEEDDRFGDPGTDELLQYLKPLVPKWKAAIGPCYPPQKSE